MALTYYCWHCRAKNDRSEGPCRECGRNIAAPVGTSFDDELLWALDHPLVERRMVAVRALARRRVERAREPLLALTGDADSYLAAAALEALVELDGLDAHRDLVERLTTHGAGAPLRAAAREAAHPRH